MKRSILFAASLLLGASAAGAQTVNSPPIALRRLASSINNATTIAQMGDARLFVTLQTGRIVIWDGTRVLATPFLDVTPLVSFSSEQGLLGLAFHPQYATNGWFFVNYTNTAGSTVVARYHVSSNPNVADSTSGVILLTIPQPFANHNGGNLRFGPDGYLYIGMGDGGSGGDPNCYAQRVDSLLGKLLRIDVNQNTGTSPFYGIPPTNPFGGTGEPAAEVWAVGLRNPWRFSFDRVTGDLFIGDVGQSNREEIDFQPAASAGGENYGWKSMEGETCFNVTSCPAYVPPCNDPSLVLPILTYDHASGDCSVTGGFRYRGATIPLLAGRYLYGDYCSGRLLAGLQTGSSWTTFQLVPKAPGLTTFGEGPVGELYLATQGGVLARIVNPPHADFDGDGKTDLVWRNRVSGLDGIWNMDGTSAASVTTFPTVLDPNWKIVGSADFNGDGKTDLLWRNGASGSTGIWIMNGPAFASTVALPTVGDLNWQIVGTGDFNHDGKPDIVWRNSSNGLNAVWLMNGTTVGSIVSLPSVFDTNWRIAGVADFNADGSADLVWRNFASGSTGIWLMNGTAFSSTAALPTVSDLGWDIVGTGDFDGDDRPDLVWHHRTSGLGGIWTMNGTSVVSVVALPTVADTSWELVGPR
jgi:hypothetical protein